MHDAAATSAPAQMVSARPIPLPLRSDTILGVCEGLGRDFGFNPHILRVALSVALLWNAYVVIAIYLGLGVIVAAARLLFPDPALQALAEERPENHSDGANDEGSLAAAA